VGVLVSRGQQLHGDEVGLAQNGKRDALKSNCLFNTFTLPFITRYKQVDPFVFTFAVVHKNNIVPEGVIVDFTAVYQPR